jgi:hypothetical protein
MDAESGRIELRERARAAAVGQDGWGSHGSAAEHLRFMVRNKKMRRRCGCGCEKTSTHVGCVNGLGMMSGCELSVRRWVRDGYGS